MEFSPRMKRNMLTAHAAAVGSMVLLKNVNQTLPLRPAGSEPLPVAVFGTGQVRTVLACPDFSLYRGVSILDGLTASPLVKPDPLLAHKYRAWALSHPTGEYPWRGLSMEELAEENAAAIVVLSRDEDAYDPIVNNDELAMIEAVTRAFPRTVLILNTPGYMEVSQAAALCSAVVYMGIPGQEGGAALSELLTGEAVFLGHLNQSWPRRRADFIQANQVLDIYAGYRYFDTFGTELLYDFGYGLTYGAAELAAVAVAVDGKELVVTAQVVNTGDTWPVSQVVQVYVSRPAGKLPQPKYTLCGFARTALLEPGRAESVTIRVPLASLASYSEASATFMLEAGFYDVRVGFSARSSLVAGSLTLNRDALLTPVLPLPMEPTKVRPAGLPYTYPGEDEELSHARRRAIRLSGWNLQKSSLRRPKPPVACRGADHPVRLSDVKAGTASVYELAAAMDDTSLRHLVLDFGLCPGGPAGALGASADLTDPYGIPPMAIAAGADGLLLTKEVRDEETDEVKLRQYCTAFPAASLLGCCWDSGLISAVGAAVGLEMQEYGVDLWLAPGSDVLRGPSQRHASRCWSEDPVMCGVYTAALCAGVQPYGAAVVRSVSMEYQTSVTLRAYLEVFSLGFAIAAPAAQAILIPTERLNGQVCGEDAPLSQLLTSRWKFKGLFLADDERFTREPSRVDLEQAALRILRFAVTRI